MGKATELELAAEQLASDLGNASLHVDAENNEAPTADVVGDDYFDSESRESVLERIAENNAVDLQVSVDEGVEMLREAGEHTAADQIEGVAPAPVEAEAAPVAPVAEAAPVAPVAEAVSNDDSPFQLLLAQQMNQLTQDIVALKTKPLPEEAGQQVHDEISDEDMGEAVKAFEDFQVGTVQEQKTAFAELQKMFTPEAPLQPVVDNDALAKQAQETNDALVKQATDAMQYQVAEQQFAKDYPDIVASPMLLREAQVQRNDVFEKATSYEQGFKLLGDKVIADRDAMIQATITPATRAERKVELVPEITSAKVTATKPKQVVETESDRIADMKRARGQQF
jgi:hypothetical protein